MIKVLKSAAQSKSSTGTAADVRGVVTEIIAAVEAHGDAAVREYSEKFDRWNPVRFRLSPEEIMRCVTSL